MTTPTSATIEVVARTAATTVGELAAGCQLRPEWISVALHACMSLYLADRKFSPVELRGENLRSVLACAEFVREENRQTLDGSDGSWDTSSLRSQLEAAESLLEYMEAVR
ncbi:hypothetical protein [Miltoncostaea marina]|uniref:hypothetical protein n=1 Tax=Miltoncostaea marina TaxID=2843215 RepID=UPI001C3D295F|nr:hypothetical protein [Miltoncostaea marina]